MISKLSHQANDIVNDIINVAATMSHGHFFGERWADALDLGREALAG